jgi:ketosteroid isomerase-like protein
MSLPLEAIIREAYDRFGRGDVDGYLTVCTTDFTFSVAGQGGICGSWTGQKGMHALASQAMALSNGTFREEVEDVLVNDQHAVVLARHRLVRDGSSKDYRTAHIYEVRDGKLSRCFEQPRDAAVFHDAWGSTER